MKRSLGVQSETGRANQAAKPISCCRPTIHHDLIEKMKRRGIQESFCTAVLACMHPRARDKNAGMQPFFVCRSSDYYFSRQLVIQSTRCASKHFLGCLLKLNLIKR
jgi:hypothetical protein